MVVHYAPEGVEQGSSETHKESKSTSLEAPRSSETSVLTAAKHPRATDPKPEKDNLGDTPSIKELTTQLSSLSNHEDRARVHHLLAQRHEATPGGLGIAAKHREQARRLTPATGSLSATFRRALAERGEYDTVCRLFDVEIQESTEPRERAELLIEKGYFLESQKDSINACLVYLEALALRADDLELWQAIIRCAQHWATHRALPTAVKPAAPLDEAAYQPTTVLHELAQVQLTESPVAAQATYELILQIDPEDLVALDALRRQHSQEAEDCSTPDNLVMFPTRSTHPSQKSDTREHAPDPVVRAFSEAIDALESLLTRSPGHYPTYADLLSLWADVDDWEEASQVLHAIQGWAAERG